MHTILGAGGPIANALTRELIKKNETIRLVSRTPAKIIDPNISWQKADLLNYQEVLKAATHSKVIYLCAGLPYDKNIWRQQWPVIIQNVINVAKQCRARLIFFDIAYMYGLVNGSMKEDTPYNPISVKGEVRAKIAMQVMKEVGSGNLNASIARAADFYGTDNGNSSFDMLVLAKYAKKGKAQWLGSPDVKHNYSYVPDCGKGIFLLGQHPESDNQIWHMPTAPPLTGAQFLEIAANIYNVKPNFTKVNKLMMQLIGLFDNVIGNTAEMFYQFDHDYIFNSDKFEKEFNYKPTSYEHGIKTLSETLYR